ncbi:hypothetical protein E8E14_009489 [Neopestalotiopsis sp. 37M]|nr:hypothetical protein E8E14_009489 [Neopestalotiopsis sp. 37M]
MALTNGIVTGSATPREAASTEQLFYQYRIIDKAKRAFRLLILRGGTGHDIDCEIVESTIDGNTLPYEAVSYTWGPSFTADTVNINGKKLPVTFNLSLILRDLRFADADRVIWVDAICIDQQDATEKGHQVGQMQDIFALAERVLFCIARPTNYTDLLLGCLDRLQSGMQNIDPNDDSAIGAAWSKAQTAIARHHLTSQPQPSESLLSIQLEALTFLQRQGLEYILGQAWFRRVWILQEVANARDALVYCGQQSVSAAVFALGARLLKYDLPDERRKTVDEVLNLMPGLVRKDPSQDLLSLFRRFGKADASVERDRIYALFGICEDKKIQTHITPDYFKSEQEVIVETIAYICHCEISVIATIPYNSIALFLSDVGLFDNTLLSHFLRSMNFRGALSILQRPGQSVFVTPDMLSVASNDAMMEEGVMSLLLEQHNAGSSLSRQEGWKPLLFAAEHGYDSLVKQMLEKGAGIDIYYPEEYNKKKKHMTPLLLAAMNGHETVVEILLKRGANMSRSYYGRSGTPLAWAARNGHSSVVQLLVKKGSDIEDDALEKRTPLSWAASRGHEDIVRLLLKHGADPTTKENGRQDTPLSRAAGNGHKVIVQVLLEDCAQVDGSRGTSTDLLYVLGAVVEKSWKRDDRREDFKAIVMMLFAKGAHFRDISKFLITAAGYGNEWMVRLFLDYSAKVDYMEKGADIEVRDSYDRTPLCLAAGSGHENTIRVLLENGADVRSTTNYKLTPLHLAAEIGHKNAVEVLLENGADIEAKDYWNRTPLDVATKKDQDVATLLLESGAIQT